MVRLIRRKDPSLKPLDYDPIDWPVQSRIRLYGEGGKCFAKNSRGKPFDLSDNLNYGWLHYGSRSNPFLIGVSVGSKRWESWNEETLAAVEQHFAYDIEFDGQRIAACRLKGTGSPCHEEALWLAVIWDDYEDQTRTYEGKALNSLKVSPLLRDGVKYDDKESQRAEIAHLD